MLVRVDWRDLEQRGVADAVYASTNALWAGVADANQQRAFVAALRSVYLQADSPILVADPRASLARAAMRDAWLEIELPSRQPLKWLTTRPTD